MNANPTRWLLLSLLALSAVGPAVAAGENDRREPDMKTVDHVDLPRYMGKWYVIAHVPTFLEKGKVGTSDNYTLQPDGTIDDVFMFRKNTLSAPEKQWAGHGHVTNQATNASWSVCLIWPFKASYRVLDLDPNYQWAVASTDSGKMVWVLARMPTLPKPVYDGIRERLSDRGLDPTELQLVPQ